MASEIDQNKLKVAIDWINKLANGMNPLDNPMCLKMLGRIILPSEAV